MSRRYFFGLCAAGVAAAAVAEPAMRATGGLFNPIADVAGQWADADFSLMSGDVVTIAGRYMVNPITRKETDFLQRFVVSQATDGNLHLYPDPGPIRAGAVELFQGKHFGPQRRKSA